MSYSLATNPESIVPIKQLKKYVSGIEENFKDFSSAKEYVKNSIPKDKCIAIVGAGPSWFKCCIRS